MQIKIDKVQKSCKDTPPVYWESFKKNKLGLTKQMGDIQSHVLANNKYSFFGSLFPCGE